MYRRYRSYSHGVPTIRKNSLNVCKFKTCRESAQASTRQTQAYTHTHTISQRTLAALQLRDRNVEPSMRLYFAPPQRTAHSHLYITPSAYSDYVKVRPQLHHYAIAQFSTNAFISTWLCRIIRPTQHCRNRSHYVRNRRPHIATILRLLHVITLQTYLTNRTNFAHLSRHFLSATTPSF